MIETLLLKSTAEAIHVLYGQSVPAESIGLEETKKEFEGDYTIVVFPLSKVSRKSPEQTATEIGNYLQTNVPSVREFKVIKGFLNIILEDEYWRIFLAENHADEGFGSVPRKKGDPVIVEYSSPNTNKPLHLGHIRNNLLGFSLARILEANGHTVIKINLVNDRGIHICKSMLAYIKWGNKETPDTAGLKGDHLIGKYYVLFNQEYQKQVMKLVSEGMPEQEAQRNAPLMSQAQEILREWEDGNAAIRELWKRMNDWAFEGFEETYRKLGVEFDIVQHESETYLLGKEIVKRGLAAKKLFQRDDSSIWADLKEDGLDEKLLLRSDGTSVYITQDLGTAQLRYDTYHPSEMIYVVGNEQNYHFDVLKLVLKKLGREWSDKIFHLSYGMVELPEGKMKSREGTVVDADDMMDEMFSTAEVMTRELGKAASFSEEEASELFRIIGLGALKYFILKVDPKKNMLFDPKESIDFNGNTGPFIQYTYARIQSLLRKAEGMGFHMWKHAMPFSVFTWKMVPQEREILRLLHRYPEVVRQAGTEFNPAVVANYTYELAKEYNQFYQEIPVLRLEDENNIQFRLMVSSFAGNIIRKSMTLLGIDVPDRM